MYYILIGYWLNKISPAKKFQFMKRATWRWVGKQQFITIGIYCSFLWTSPDKTPLRNMMANGLSYIIRKTKLVAMMRWSFITFLSLYGQWYLIRYMPCETVLIDNRNTFVEIGSKISGYSSITLYILITIAWSFKMNCITMKLKHLLFNQML